MTDSFQLDKLPKLQKKNKSVFPTRQAEKEKINRSTLYYKGVLDSSKGKKTSEKEVFNRSVTHAYN